MDDLHKKSSIFLYKIVEKNIDFQGVKSKIKESKKSGLTKSQTERKGGSETNSLTDVLKEELNCETVFTIPIGKGIPVFESVVVTWVIMAVLAVIGLIILFFKGPRYQGKMRYKLNIPLIAVGIAAFAGTTKLALEKRVLSNYFGNIAFAYED